MKNARHFRSAAKEQLTLISRLRDQLRALLPLVPVHREPELQALDSLLERRSNELLEGGNLDHDVKAIEEVALIGAFHNSVIPPARQPESEDE